MAKKCKLNEKSLLALFDYNLFSPDKKLERLAKESLARTNRSLSEEPLNLDTLEELSAAGNANTTKMPKKHG